MTYYTLGRAVAAISAILALSTGCTDAEHPTAVPAGAQASTNSAQAGIIHETPILPAFDVQLSASGSMQPGRPITVHVRVRANLPVDDAELVISTPDVDRPVAPTLDQRSSRALKKAPRDRLTRRGNWKAGQGLNESMQLTIPAPGYYRVTASVTALSEVPAYVDAGRVVRAIHREIWLRVDKRGGRYTARFDTLALPPEAEHRAGPLHCTVDLEEERRGRKRSSGCDGALVTVYDAAENSDGPVAIMVGDEVCLVSVDGGCGGTCTGVDYCGEDPCLTDPYACGTGEPYTAPAPTDPCMAGTHLCIEFVYWSPVVKRYVPAPEGTLVEGSYQDKDCFIGCWWTEERSTFVKADSLGRVILRCPSSSTEKRLRTAYEFLDDYSAVSRSEWHGPWVSGACPTGWRTVEMVANQEAYVFGNIRKSAQRAHRLFGYPSPRVRVDFDGGFYQEFGQLASWYDAPAHAISINDNDIWGYEEEGAATQAHEYGHSYHNMALGGIGHIYITGDPRHEFDKATYGSQALLEGFADFFETLVMPGKSTIHAKVRWPPSSLPLGPKGEARVAAYLWDVIDRPDERGTEFESPTSSDFWGTVSSSGRALESFDQAQVSPYTLGRVIDGCGSPSWGFLDTRPESIEGIHRCLKAYPSYDIPAASVLDRIYSANINGVVE